MTGGLGALAATDREHVWKSASFYPFTHLMRYGRGVSLRAEVACEKYDIPGYQVDDTTEYCTQKDVDYLDTAAAYDEASGALNVFVINRSLDSDDPLAIDVGAFPGLKFVEHIRMYSPDIDAANTFDNPDAVVPSADPDTHLEGGTLRATLKPLSWNVFRFAR